MISIDRIEKTFFDVMSYEKLNSTITQFNSCQRENTFTIFLGLKFFKIQCFLSRRVIKLMAKTHMKAFKCVKNLKAYLLQYFH